MIEAYKNYPKQYYDIYKYFNAISKYILSLVPHWHSLYNSIPT